MALPDRSTIWGEWFMNESSGTNVPNTSSIGASGDLTTGNSPTWVSGKIDNCLNFSPASSHALAANATIFNPDYDDAFSVNYWPNGVATGVKRIFSKFGTKGILIGGIGTRRAHFQLYGSAGSNLQVTGTTAMTDSVWHNVGWSYDGSTNASGTTCVQDGSEETIIVITDTLSSTILDAVAKFEISGYNNGAAQFWDGLVDIARFSTIGTEWTVLNHQAFWNSGAGVEEYPSVGGGSDDHIKRYYY